MLHPRENWTEQEPLQLSLIHILVVREYSNIEFIDNYDQRLMIELYYAEEIIKRGKADSSIISDMEKYYGEMEDFLHRDGELAGLTWVNCEDVYKRQPAMKSHLHVKEWMKRKLWLLF